MLQARLQVRGFDAIAQLVEAGLGVALLPAAVAERLSRSFDVEVLALNEPWAKREYLIAARKQEVQPAANWEQAARNAGVPQDKINAMDTSIDQNRAGAAVDPAAVQRAEEALVAASWISLVGVLLSLGTCIGGAMVGRGPSLRLFQPRVQVESRQELIIP